MKSITRRIVSLLSIASLFLLVMFFYSCDLLPAKASSPAQRIQYFQQDLNNGGKASDLINDMWSGMADYGALKDQNTWDISVLAGAHAPYSFTANGSAASAKYSSSDTVYNYLITNTAQSGVSISFWLTNPTGDNWQIRAIEQPTNTLVFD